MRILFVSWRDLAHPQAGGAELMVDRLALGALERGHDAALLSGGPVEQRAYPVIDAGGTYGQYLRAPVEYLRRFRGWDVIVDSENGIPFWSPLWQRGPVVILVHHVHGDQWRLHFPAAVARLGWFLERRAMPLVYRRSLYLTVSRSTAAALEGIGVRPEQVRVVPVGTDPVDRAHEESPEPLFLSFGRLAAHKRHDLLLRIWQRVRPLTGGTLVIAGHGPERSRLETMVGPGVELRGFVSDEERRELLSRSWLALGTALHEGWGSALMEAAAAGTPALALDVPGVRDSVVDGETGRLVHSEDELAAAWVELARSPARRAELGAAARRRAGRFTWDATVDAFLAVAAEAVGRHRLRAAGR